MELSGRTVLLTGASGGLGEAFARLLHARGAKLIVTGRKKDRLDALAAALGATPIVVDLAADPSALLRALADRGLEPELAVLNAGAGVNGPFAERAIEGHAATIRLNAEATTTLAHALVQPMIRARRGGLLFVASTASFQPAPGYAVYAATKAYLRSFGVALHEELRGTGVRVTVACPGPIATEFHVNAGLAAMPASLRPLVLSPDEVARRALDGWTKGRALVVPGGMNAAGRAFAALTPDPIAARLARRMFE
jgi:uncharacterized protein